MNLEALGDVLSAAWGPWSPVAEADGVAVVRALPSRHRPWFTWATCGLGHVAPAAGPPEAAWVEIVTYSADDAAWPVHLLGQLVVARTSGATLLPYDTLALDGPLDEGSSLTGVALLPPYFEADETATLGGTPGGALRWALPVTTAELELAVLAGGRALEQVLLEADIRPWPELGRASWV